MSLSDWHHFHSRFLALGGEVQNLTPRVGVRGRGLFAVDFDRPSGVFCPKQIFLNTQHLVTAPMPLAFSMITTTIGAGTEAGEMKPSAF